MKKDLKELIYVEHFAGDFEDGIQVCIHCGKVITDYSGGGWVSSDGNTLVGWSRGPIWIREGNPTQMQNSKPEENYGEDDPFIRKTPKCTELKYRP